MSKQPEDIEITATPLLTSSKEDTSDAMPSVENIRQMLMNGSQPEMIAEKLGLSVEVVRKVTMTQRSSYSPMPTPIEEEHPRTILNTQLVTTLAAIEIAKEAYDDKPTQGNALALTALITTSQSLLHDLEKHKDPVAQVNMIDEKILRPMITDWIRELTNEMHETRKEVLKQVEVSHQGSITQTFNAGLQGFGQKTKMIYDGSILKLKALMGVKE